MYHLPNKQIYVLAKATCTIKDRIVHLTKKTLVSGECTYGIVLGSLNDRYHTLFATFDNVMDAFKLYKALAVKKLG